MHCFATLNIRKVVCRCYYYCCCCCYCYCYLASARGIFICGYSPGSLGDGSPPLGPEVKPWWGSSRRSWSSLQTLFTDFDCRNDQNLNTSHNLPPDSWQVCFTVGAEWPIWVAKLSLAHASCRRCCYCYYLHYCDQCQWPSLALLIFLTCMCKLGSLSNMLHSLVEFCSVTFVSEDWQRHRMQHLWTMIKYEGPVFLVICGPKVVKFWWNVVDCLQF